MNFRQRLLRFIIGIAIGFILVQVFFGERGCGHWLPGNQVKKWIKENNANIEVMPETTCMMKCQGLTPSDIEYVLGEEGDVIFGESQTKGYPKEYIIQGNRDTIEFRFGFILREDSSSIVSLAQRLDVGFKCDCDY